MVATITMGAKTTYMTLKLLAHVTKSRHITVRALKAHYFHRSEENLTTFRLIPQQSTARFYRRRTFVHAQMINAYTGAYDSRIGKVTDTKSRQIDHLHVGKI